MKKVFCLMLALCMLALIPGRGLQRAGAAAFDGNG